MTLAMLGMPCHRVLRSKCLLTHVSPFLKRTSVITEGPLLRSLPLNEQRFPLSAKTSITSEAKAKSLLDIPEGLILHLTNAVAARHDSLFDGRQKHRLSSMLAKLKSFTEEAEELSTLLKEEEMRREAEAELDLLAQRVVQVVDEAAEVLAPASEAAFDEVRF